MWVLCDKLLAFLNPFLHAAHIIYTTVVQIPKLTTIKTTNFHPAKGRPGSRSIKLDSGAQKRLRQSPSKATGHAPRPARDWPVPKSASVQVCERPLSASHCAVHRSWPVRTFSKSAILHRFPNFYTLRVYIFRMFFIRSRLPMTLKMWFLIRTPKVAIFFKFYYFVFRSCWSIHFLFRIACMQYMYAACCYICPT